MQWNCFLYEDDSNALGYVIFYKNSVIYVGVAWGCSISSTKKVETRAIILGMKKANHHILNKIHILSNALEVFKAIEVIFLRNLIQDIMDLSKCFVSLRINHISRHLKWAALDAKFWFNISEEFEWFNSFQIGLLERTFWCNSLALLLFVVWFNDNLFFCTEKRKRKPCLGWSLMPNIAT